MVISERHGSRARRARKGLCNYRLAGRRLCEGRAARGSAKDPVAGGMGFCARHLDYLRKEG